MTQEAGLMELGKSQNLPAHYHEFVGRHVYAPTPVGVRIISVAQPLSKAVAEDGWAKAGDFVNAATLKNFGRNLRLVAIDMTNDWRIMRPRKGEDKGLEQLAALGFDAEGAPVTMWRGSEADARAWKCPDGRTLWDAACQWDGAAPPLAQLTYVFAVVPMTAAGEIDAANAGFMLMARGSASYGKALYAQLQAAVIDGKPLFTLALDAESVKEPDDSFTYFTPRVKISGQFAVGALTDQLYKMAKACRGAASQADNNEED